MNENSTNSVKKQVFHRGLQTLRLPKLVEADPRVLALRLNLSAETLGQMLFGPGRRALLLLLITRKRSAKCCRLWM